MTKLETIRFLEQISSLSAAVPVLQDAAVLAGIRPGNNSGRGLLHGRIERRYKRLCRVQEELTRLDLKKAAPGALLEDYVFSRIDFSRYRKISEKDFEESFIKSFADFYESFFFKNFRHGRKELQTVIESSYTKAEGSYRLLRESSLVLSVMRELETSPEAAPLFSAEEIMQELQILPKAVTGKLTRDIKEFYKALVFCIDNAVVTHSDGMTTKLFISPRGDLSGTFRPADKPWTQVLVPAELPGGPVFQGAVVALTASDNSLS